MTARAFVKFVVLLLIGGAMISIIIAWGGSIGLANAGRVQFGAGPLDQRDDTSWFVWRAESTLRTLIETRGSPEPVDSGATAPASVLPAWSSIDAARMRRHVTDHRDAPLFEIAYGWPFRVLRVERLETADGRVFTGLRLKPDYVLPTGVILPGLVMNTLVCAVVVCAPLFLPSALARWGWRRSRRRRGLCVTCGYPLRSAPRCPECGRRST